MRLADQINKQFENSELMNSLGKKVTCLQLKKLLRKELSKFDAAVRIVRDIKPEESSFMISGVYDPDRDTDVNITIYLHVSKLRKYITLTKVNLHTLVFLVIQTLQHELVHRSSHRTVTKRINIRYSNILTKKKRDDIKYLTDHDEIDAYAHDIAMEIKQYYGYMSNKEIFSKLNQLKKLQSYMVYKETFSGLEWDVVRKALLKKIWKWLPQIVPPKFVALAK